MTAGSGEFALLRGLVQPLSTSVSLRQRLDDLADRGRIPPPGGTVDEDYVTHLLEKARTGDEAVRRDAAFALQQIGVRHPNAIEGYRDEFGAIARDATVTEVQGYIINLLRAMEARSVLEDLATGFTEQVSQGDSSELAVAGLEQISWRYPGLVEPAVDDLLEYLQDADHSEAGTAVTALLCVAAWNPAAVEDHVADLVEYVVSADDPFVTAGMQDAEMLVPVKVQWPDQVVPVLYQSLEKEVYGSREAAAALVMAAGVQGNRLASQLP